MFKVLTALKLESGNFVSKSGNVQSVSETFDEAAQSAKLWRTRNIGLNGWIPVGLNDEHFVAVLGGGFEIHQWITDTDNQF